MGKGRRQLTVDCIASGGAVGSAAPRFVRQPIYFYDTHLSAGQSIALPTAPGFDWLYFFCGAVSIADMQAGMHMAFTISADQTMFEVTASLEVDLSPFWLRP
jgi:hypothetical protein